MRPNGSFLPAMVLAACSSMQNSHDEGIYIEGLCLQPSLSVAKVVKVLGVEDTRTKVEGGIQYSWLRRDGLELALTFDSAGGFIYGSVYISRHKASYKGNVYATAFQTKSTKPYIYLGQSKLGQVRAQVQGDMKPEKGVLAEGVVYYGWRYVLDGLGAPDYVVVAAALWSYPQEERRKTIRDSSLVKFLWIGPEPLWNKWKEEESPRREGP